jgi:RNA polymerase sigma-70 factor (ECF subfamily)
VATRQDEFEALAMPHTRSLLRVARRLTSDSSMAEDLVQEAMLLAWRNFAQLREGASARAWLFRILMNAFYAQGRKIRSTPAMVSIDAGEWSQPLWVPAPSIAAADAARALETLTEEHRTVLLLGVVEGFTCQEIADILVVPLGTVMSRLSRARQALRNRLEPKRNELKCAKKEA